MKPKIAIVMGVLLVLSGQAWAGRPTPDTGQTQCYDYDHNPVSCPEPGETLCHDQLGNPVSCPQGQDANYTINPMSFTKLDSAGRELADDAAEWLMVRDNVTGLIWEVKQNEDETVNYADPHDADNTYTWYDPNPATNGGNAGTPSANDTVDFITTLNNDNFGGYHDWRMPSREELRSIVDYSIPSPGPTIMAIYFPNCISSNYWSSSTGAPNPGYAWGVYFDSGSNYNDLKSDDRYVRAVRGGQ